MGLLKGRAGKGQGRCRVCGLEHSGPSLCDSRTRRETRFYGWSQGLSCNHNYRLNAKGDSVCSLCDGRGPVMLVDHDEDCQCATCTTRIASPVAAPASAPRPTAPPRSRPSALAERVQA